MWEARPIDADRPSCTSRIATTGSRHAGYGLAGALIDARTRPTRTIGEDLRDTLPTSSAPHATTGLAGRVRPGRSHATVIGGNARRVARDKSFTEAETLPDVVRQAALLGRSTVTDADRRLHSIRCWHSTRPVAHSSRPSTGAWLYGSAVRRDLRRDRTRRLLRSCPADSILFIAGHRRRRSANLNVHVLVARADRCSRSWAIPSTTRSATTSGPKVFHAPGLAAGSSGEYLTTNAGVLRQVRRHHDHHRPLHPDHPHVRAVPRRRGGHVAIDASCSFNIDRRPSRGSTPLVYAGYLFGNIPWVKQNLSLIVVGDRRSCR